MSEMYFDVSEHIARDYPKSDVCEVDEFLTRTNPLEFKLHDIEDSTNVNENAKAIVNEYIKHGIVVKETRYFCPKHKNTVLERPKGLIPSRKRTCPKCEKSYSINGLETQAIYIRKKDPDRAPPLDTATTGEATERPEKRWWKDPKWIIERAQFGCIILISLATCGLTAYGLFLEYQPEAVTSTPTLAHSTVEIVQPTSAPLNSQKHIRRFAVTDVKRPTSETPLSNSPSPALTSSSKS